MSQPEVNGTLGVIGFGGNRSVYFNSVDGSGNRVAADFHVHRFHLGRWLEVAPLVNRRPYRDFHTADAFIGNVEYQPGAVAPFHIYAQRTPDSRTADLRGQYVGVLIPSIGDRGRRSSPWFDSYRNVHGALATLVAPNNGVPSARAHHLPDALGSLERIMRRAVPLMTRHLLPEFADSLHAFHDGFQRRRVRKADLARSAERGARYDGDPELLEQSGRKNRSCIVMAGIRILYVDEQVKRAIGFHDPRAIRRTQHFQRCVAATPVFVDHRPDRRLGFLPLPQPLVRRVLRNAGRIPPPVALKGDEPLRDRRVRDSPADAPPAHREGLRHPLDHDDAIAALRDGQQP